MSRFWLVVLWLAVGNITLGGLYWWLLNVPESSVWMVGLSALLVLAFLLMSAITISGAALRWMPAVNPRAALRRALQGVPAFLLAAAVCAAIFWATMSADGWFARHAGEIDATFMSRLGWTSTAWFHRGMTAVLYVLRVIVGPTIALSALIFVLFGGRGELGRTRWLRAALSRRVLGAVAIFEVALLLLPLQALYWKPRGLPTSQVEPIFVATKLAIIFLLGTAGFALMLRAIVGAAAERTAAEQPLSPLSQRPRGGHAVRDPA